MSQEDRHQSSWFALAHPTRLRGTSVLTVLSVVNLRLATESAETHRAFTETPTPRDASPKIRNKKMAAVVAGVGPPLHPLLVRCRSSRLAARQAVVRFTEVNALSAQRGLIWP